MSTAIADGLDAENPLIEGLERLPVHSTALVIFGVYRRVRRSFGQQPVNVTRIWIRVGILILVAVLAAAGVGYTWAATVVGWGTQE